MTRLYMLDSNAANDLFNGLRGVDIRAAAVRRAGGRIGTCAPVAGELLEGVEGSATRDKNRKLILAGLRVFTIWPFVRWAAAVQFGLLSGVLARRGDKIQQVDMQLAAVARVLGNCTVVSSDSDLRRVPGLVVENWAV